MAMRQLPYGAAFPETGRARLLAAGAVHRASLWLAGLARRLQFAETPPAGEPVLEFYAEAGAPEGALYLDGQLVGYVHGVSRL
jgi:hypothetical protein